MSETVCWVCSAIIGADDSMTLHFAAAHHSVSKIEYRISQLERVADRVDQINEEIADCIRLIELVRSAVNEQLDMIHKLQVDLGVLKLAVLKKGKK